MAQLAPCPAAPDVFEQIEALPIEADRPLIVTDADEVLFVFMADFERYLDEHGHYFDWRSYALLGNVRRRSDGGAVDWDATRRLLDGFFDARTESMDAAPGASESLATLNLRAQIVVLSNLPHTRRPERSRALELSGMDYPLISNEGPKGPAVHALAARVEAPVFFIDDAPTHHESVAEHADAVRRLHMVADSRLARIVPAADSHHRVDDWPGARAIIEAELSAAGY